MKITHGFSIAVLFAIAGCEGEGVTRPPPADVWVFDAAPNATSIVLRREEERLPIDEGDAAALPFGRGVRKDWDSGTYDLNFEHFRLSNGFVRTETLNATLSTDVDYLFVAVSPNSQPDLLTFTTPNRPNPTAPRITVAHAFPGLGNLDVYMTLPGTLPVATSPRGTIAYAGDALTFEIPAETHKIYLTTAGNPNDVVFESTEQDEGEIGLNGLLETIYVVTDPGGQGTAEISLYQVGTSPDHAGSPPQAHSREIAQIGLQSGMRAVQAITDRLDRDIHLDDTLSPPLFPAQAFGVLSDYAEIVFGPHDLIVTPAGNPGTAELTSPHVAFPGDAYTFMVGSTLGGTIAARIILEDNRSIIGQATISVLNAAGLFEAIAIYIEPPGTDITAQPAPVALAPLGFTQRDPLHPGDYEITITNLQTQAILAGPMPITLEDGGVYGILLVNGAGGSTVDIVLFDDFVP